MLLLSLLTALDILIVIVIIVIIVIVVVILIVISIVVVIVEITPPLSARNASDQGWLLRKITRLSLLLWLLSSSLLFS